MSLRALLTLLIATGFLSSLHLRAEEPMQRVVRIGFVGTTSPSTFPSTLSVFWDRLRELGYLEGQNLVIESRWAEGRVDQLPVLMRELVARKVDVIVTWGTPATIAAKNSTGTTPIVFMQSADPIGAGLAASLARPGRNVTGLSAGWADIGGKWLELLAEAVPRLATVAVVGNPENPANQKQAKDLESLAATRGLKLVLIEVRETASLDRAFEHARRKAEAVIVLADPVTMSNQSRILALTAKHRLPDMYSRRDPVTEGGLMAYGPDLVAVFQRAAEYVDKILKGAKADELPIEQATRYMLAVNLKTAKARGLTIPQSILLRADEVIQ